MKPTLSDRRRFPRITVGEPSVVSPTFADRKHVAYVTDVSAGGISLRLKDPLPVDGVLRIHIFDAILLGKVRYCALVDGRWHAGVEFDEVAPRVADLAQLARIT